MIEATVKKVALLLTVFTISTAALVKGMDLVNAAVSRSIAADNEIVTIDSAFDGALHILEGIQPVAFDRLQVSIVSNGRPLALMISDLKFGHEIFVNGRLISQNTNETAEAFDSSYAYKVFRLESQSTAGGRISVTILGEHASQVRLFLADPDHMSESVELRTICYSFMLMSLILLTFSCLLLYFKNRSSSLFLLFACIGVVSVLKSIDLGEPIVLAKAVGFTFRQFTPIDSATSAINLVLPVFVMLCLFDLYPKNKWRLIIVLFAALMTALTLILGYTSSFYLFYAGAVYLVSVALSIYGCMRNKRFCIIVMSNTILFSSCTLYATFVRAGIFRHGLLSFFVNPSYLGALIYLCVFLIVYIGYSLNELRTLEEQKKRYERLTLLRGISHDLRLPLSVIKMNNQMLEKYPMTAAERQECLRMSIGAVRELENMTGNINSYLNLEASDTIPVYSSIQNSFHKIQEHYATFSKGTDIRFQAVWQGEDRTLRVAELMLDRLLFNLVDNAFKYNRPGGTVTLTCRTNEESLFIAVADTGIGMDRASIQNMFAPFYRSDQSRGKEGLGLGLCVVQGITESLKGQISVESIPGSGTRIEVTIPLQE